MNTQSQVTDSIPQPWYRHPWPWILMSFPFAAILVGILLLSIVLTSPSDVVVDNYYREGRGINQTFELDHTARALGLSASLHHSAETGETMLAVNALTEAGLLLFVYNATDRSRDQEFVFLPAGEGYFRNNDEQLGHILQSEGIWYLEIRGTEDNWRLRKRLQTPARNFQL